MMATEELTLTGEWDKTFPPSDRVFHRKVTFANHFGITLAADLYTPKNAEGRLPAIAVCGPFGACKEQASGLYAQEMAERGFLTVAFDSTVEEDNRNITCSSDDLLSCICRTGCYEVDNENVETVCNSCLYLLELCALVVVTVEVLILDASCFQVSVQSGTYC